MYGKLKISFAFMKAAYCVSRCCSNADQVVAESDQQTPSRKGDKTTPSYGSDGFHCGFVFCTDLCGGRFVFEYVSASKDPPASGP